MAFARTLLRALSVLALGSCGGGGDGGSSAPAPAPPTVSFIFPGTLAPPSFVVNADAAGAIGLVGTPAPTDLRFPPGFSQVFLPAVCQSAQYLLDPAALPTRRATAVTFASVNPCGFSVSTGPPAYAGDPSLGQLSSIQEADGRVSISLGAGMLAIDNSGPQPAAVLTQTTSSVVSTAGFALPRSATLNPAGFLYQTFGRWAVEPRDGTVTDGFFSMGITNQAIPAAGVATYSGVGRGTFVSAATGELFEATATFVAQVDFAARTITFTTSANPAPDFSARLVFPAATNTFFGPIDGATGNVMGRFYGQPLASATATKAAGSPPEIGGTFGAFFPGIGSLIGSFGGQ